MTSRALFPALAGFGVACGLPLVILAVGVYPRPLQKVITPPAAGVAVK